MEKPNLSLKKNQKIFGMFFQKITLKMY